ncbi:MAG: hypothetical protein QME64_10515 [bacterium]|nr:hypothetical protein [bacterium]
MDIEKIRTIISLLKMVADGELDPDLALERWPDIDKETDKLIAASWHDLSHFANDTDIRKKDKEYDIMQRNLLRKNASEIHQKYQPM